MPKEGLKGLMEHSEEQLHRLFITDPSIGEVISPAGGGIKGGGKTLFLYLYLESSHHMLTNEQ